MLKLLLNKLWKCNAIIDKHTHLYSTNKTMKSLALAFLNKFL